MNKIQFQVNMSFAFFKVVCVRIKSTLLLPYFSHNAHSETIHFSEIVVYVIALTLFQ